MYQALLSDANFHQQLLEFDRDLAAMARDGGCGFCSGRLHSARYLRKSRGVPRAMSEEYRHRFSFCCAEDGCRKRVTPASLRFLGRKVYLATIVTLVSALQHGVTPARLRRLSAALGIDRRTVARWRQWWLCGVAAGRFWRANAAAFMPPVDITRLPASLLDRFAGDAGQRLLAVLRWLAPITGGASWAQDF